MRLFPTLAAAAAAALPALAQAQTTLNVPVDAMPDPIQGSLTMIFGGFAVVVVLAVSIASHQRP